MISDAYVEIGPDDADYARLAEQALTQEEFDERRRRWQEGDESLRRQFLDFLARRGHPGRRADAGERRAVRRAPAGSRAASARPVSSPDVGSASRRRGAPGPLTPGTAGARPGCGCC